MKGGNLMKPYEKPTFQFIELRIEERIARCSEDPLPSAKGKKTSDFSAFKEGSPPGDNPGCNYSCPS
jgi:hypothetical protein